jgi:polysaccharide deacetylase 2 family uncharacterized protein YibQ
MTRSKKRKKARSPQMGSKSGIIIFFLLVAGLFVLSLYYDYFYQEPDTKKSSSIEKKENHNKIKTPRSSSPRQRKTSPSEKDDRITQEARYIPQHKKRQSVPGSKYTYPEQDSHDLKLKDTRILRDDDKLPKVAIVIDDMGLNKKGAYELFTINGKLTFSILPQRPYSKWVAHEGHKRGYEIMAHIPMEPLDNSNKPGKGALYTWMTDDDIRQTLIYNLDSIPYVAGFNNHMGSAFTQDKRSIEAALSSVNGRNLFFLDSLTTSGSVAASVSREQGLRTYRRDIFLDAENDYQFIESQWKKLVKIAEKKGQAIAIGHPYKNTILFLKNNLPSKDINIVPISEIVTQ